ncbi:hypothetical protein MPSEU_000716400 [Mayamaea pseudoterrestris]|nr:hypothetical protein MPSEU_000716400 [Mayamaea pseudoterrestris]
MIRYEAGPFGLNVLWRLHGSAVFKSIVPALGSSVIYLLLFELTNEENELLFLHPYPIGALIAALTFLLSYRATFAYNRYWEACSAVYLMHSRWMDLGTSLAAFHLQSSKYKGRKPPSFGHYPHLRVVERERERLNEPTLDELEVQLLDAEKKPSETIRSRIGRTFRKAKEHDMEHGGALYPSMKVPMDMNDSSSSIDFDTGTVNKIETRNIGPSIDLNTDEPALFLEEAAHLLSLLSAVALSTLRNDLEHADSPLCTFYPGQPFPHVDPDNYNADVRKGWKNERQSVTLVMYLLGFSRSKASRTLYNAARPLRVVGGVSDAEVALLQAARGPMAKVALVSMWLQEFITREHLSGSTGKVGAPIIGRLFQYISDGMLGYNMARKVAYIPFPFAHAQITSLFVLVVIGVMPLLMLSFVTNEIFGALLNFVTVCCFCGLDSVAKELEDPFFNPPNDIPVNNLHAQFNEAIMTMFRGWHPDAYWRIKREPAGEGANGYGRDGDGCD